MTDNKLRSKTVIWLIALYIVVMSIYDSVWGDSLALGFRLIPTACILAFLIYMMKKDDCFRLIGFMPMNGLPYRKLLYLLPMIAVATANLWGGAVMRFPVVQTIFYVLSMFCIGFSEEILFRGYLLRLLIRRSVKTAILVSSLTFGLGHLINLISGSDLFSTGLQVIYALSIGLMLSVFVVKTGNIVPCCLFHGLFNALAAFCNERAITDTSQIVTCAGISVISLGYAWYIWKKLPEVQPRQEDPA